MFRSAVAVLSLLASGFIVQADARLTQPRPTTQAKAIYVVSKYALIPQPPTPANLLIAQANAYAVTKAQANLLYPGHTEIEVIFFPRGYVAMICWIRLSW